MENQFKITIPKPCHEDWNAMSQEQNGRFCSSCTKTVVDFTKMKSLEIQEYFIQNQQQKVCGRFKNEQINRFDILIPQSVLKQQMSFHKAFLLTLFIVMGTTLFSCKNHDDASLGEVSVVEDTVHATHTMGIPLPPKEYDSLVEKEVVALPPVKNANEKISQKKLPNATLGITVIKPLVDSTKVKKE